VPFITGSFTNTGTATTSPFQTIERKDVGTTLRIKPQIGENGTVRLTIYQESSSIAGTHGGRHRQRRPPTTNKRSIESTIVVDDGQIIVLGGLIEDNYTSNRSKIPLLGDIPWLGALFRSENRTRKRTNLMVFLRPVVMRDQAGSNKISLDRYDFIRGQQLDSQPPPSTILRINESPVLPQPAAPNATSPSRRAAPARRHRAAGAADDGALAAGLGAACTRCPRRRPNPRRRTDREACHPWAPVIRFPTPTRKRTRCCSKTMASASCCGRPSRSPCPRCPRFCVCTTSTRSNASAAPSLAHRIAVAYAGSESSCSDGASARSKAPSTFPA